MTANVDVPVGKHADRNLALLLGLPIVLFAVLLAPWVIHHWVERAGASDIQDASSLPWQIAVCGREWQRGQVLVTTTLEAERARSGVEPVVVDIAPFAPCPAGPCTASAQASPCSTVVLVRVGEGDYVAFDLVGGP